MTGSNKIILNKKMQINSYNSCKKMNLNKLKFNKKNKKKSKMNIIQNNKIWKIINNQFDNKIFFTKIFFY